jgi:ribosomal protein S12 methylthiotransferase
VKEERYARIMELTARISAEKLAAKVGLDDRRADRRRR